MTGGESVEGIFPGKRGVYAVTTFNGTQYLVNLDELTVTRFSNPDDPDPEKNLRQDGETRPLLAFELIVIGQGMTLILDIRGDGIPTRRQTSTVTRIENRA